MNRLIEALLDTVWPRMCPCCGRVLLHGETSMCLHCRSALPLTNYHLNPTDNALRSKLNGLVPLERATAYFHYHRNSPYASLIHEAKYAERPALAQELGREYARILARSNFFNGIDALIPVPLNFWKECRRGYNQSAHIAMGVAREVNAPIILALKARRHTTQTHKDANQRRLNAEASYFAIPEALNGLTHALLIDDVCTTGATLYACARALHQVNPNLCISVLTLADTRKL